MNKNVNPMERTAKLMEHLEAKFPADVVPTTNLVVCEAMEYIKSNVINTGKTFMLLLVNDSKLCTSEFKEKLTKSLHDEALLHVDTVYPSVLKIQCAKKIQRIQNLNSIQLYMFELRDFNPELVKRGYEKLTPEEQEEIKAVLLFEK